MKTLGDYIKEVQVTAQMNKPREVVGYTFAAGLCGEAAECYQAMSTFLEWGDAPYTKDHPRHTAAVKELGDVMWYLGAMIEWTGRTEFMGSMLLDEVQEYCEHIEFDESALMLSAGRVAELMKKHIGHDRPFDPIAFRSALTSCLVDCSMTAEMLGIFLSEVCEINIAKLRERFKGGGFSAELANAPRTGS